ncbi:hypothetical protein ISF_08586 [Cordyceps fumosorosea ARSEF 2679]|uniref:Uncharacterized protein n=1 Tax=Cordyceps fumosorosea (strain ARSEF 2679) TaxID=1081104 RepID=A0A167M3R0_CORFA|nr:hypothetical protein ISF_08586 [Cordyceps fumosorosea ARSEF 2679]OAA53884.1 hypothetical protein ISF_08586 [Cordyceps fumosorosea ARSEF 2679]
MAQPTAAPKPRSGFSRFSKALPAVPQLLKSSSSNSPSSSSSPPPASYQLPSLPKNLPDSLPDLPKDLPDLPPPPPPPPRDDGPAHGSAPPQLPRLPDKSPSLPVLSAFLSNHSATPTEPSRKMDIPRRPVAAASNNAMLSPFPEPSPTASISSLISAYTRPYDSPTTTPHTGTYPDTPLASSRETSPPPPDVPEKNSDRPTNRKNLPPAQIRKVSPDDNDVPPTHPSKSELWRRRPQNDSREISGLKLDHSHGSTVSSTISIVSTSTASTQRPPTAVQDEPSNSPPPKPRIPRSVGGLPGRNVRPPAASKDDLPPSTTPSKPVIAAVQSKKSLPSLRKTAVTPPTNRPPTPEYQPGESRAPAAATFISPASPESPSRFSPVHAKTLPPPPPQNLAGNASGSTMRKPAWGMPSSVLTEMPRRKPATTPTTAPATTPATAPATIPATASATTPPPAPAITPAVTAPVAAAENSPSRGDVFAKRPRLPPAASPIRARSPLVASTPSDQSRGSSLSPRRLMRRDPDQTPRQQRRPASDQRIVQTEQGPMYRGRDGTLYPEMKYTHEPDARAFRFPAWKGKDSTTVSVDGVYAAGDLKESHYSCFQKHATMNRRANRHYPLTCQTCSIADAEDRWACTFCHLRICEACFRTLNTNQRDLKAMVAAST